MSLENLFGHSMFYINFVNSLELGINLPDVGYPKVGV